MRRGDLNDRRKLLNKLSTRCAFRDQSLLMSCRPRGVFIDPRRTGNPVRRKVRSRGVPPALANNEIFYTESVREATSLLSRALAPGWITVHEDVSGFAATMHGVRLRNVSMLYLDLHVRSTLEIP